MMLWKLLCEQNNKMSTAITMEKKCTHFFVYVKKIDNKYKLKGMHSYEWKEQQEQSINMIARKT